MAGNRITLTLDFPFTEMVGEGWGMSKLAGGFTFIDRTSDNAIIQTGIPKGYWKVPTIGVLSLAPTLVTAGSVAYTETSSNAFQESEVDIAQNSDGTAAMSFLEVAGGYTRTRPGRTDALIGLLGSIAQVAILAELSTTLKTIWRTKNLLKANEGFGVLVAPRRTFDALNANAYITFTFGKYYFLGVDLQGTATLFENLGDDTTPQWFPRRTMDLASVGVDATKPWQLMVVPCGGRYVIFRFGNVRYRGGGFRLESYTEFKDFRFDVVNEGRGNRWDAGINQFVCIEPGKLSIAVNETGTDYTFLPLKLRYDPTTAYVAKLGAEPIPYPAPGQVPELDPRGYATGYSNGGGGTMTMVLQNGLGGAWDDDSTQVCPVVTMRASSDGIYTPELWYLDANLYPETHIPNWTPYDASADWQYLRFARSISGPCSAEITMKGEGRYGVLFQRGGPFEIAVDGEPVLDGYFHTHRSTLAPVIIENEDNARDMWERLKVSCGSFESLDGKSIGQTIYRLLRRCGFPDDQIQIENSNLGGLTFGDFDEPQTLKLYNDDTLVEDAIKDIEDKTSIQGVEGIRVRWNGSLWRVYFASRQGTGDPVTILYSTDDWSLSGTPVASMDDAARWGNNLLKITSAIEFDVQNPEFNALTGKCVSEGSNTASQIVISAGGDGDTDEVTSTFANLPTNTRSQAFEGRLRSKTAGPPQITATTFPELRKQLRFIYEDEMSKTVGAGVQAEWQDLADADMEFCLIGRNPITGDPTSYGVWNVEHIDIDVHADDQNEKKPDGTDLLVDGEPVVNRRAFEWSGAYRLRWRRATSDDFPVPMYAGPLPPTSY